MGKDPAEQRRKPFAGGQFTRVCRVCGADGAGADGLCANCATRENRRKVRRQTLRKKMKSYD